jgi:hypothetical protein
MPAYSSAERRSLVGMDARRVVSMRPLVVLAIRLMSPGPRRVQMVKLAHAMSEGRGVERLASRRLRLAPDPHRQDVAPSRRAA